MRISTLALTLTLPAILTTTASASSMPQSLTHDALIHQQGLPRISVGVGYESQEREIVGGSAQGRLRGIGYGGYLGVDLFNWVTLYGTLGVLDVDRFELPGAPADFDEDSRWSIGLAATLWQLDITEPAYMRGRLSIGVAVERVENTVDGDAAELEWTETAVAVPFGYELPAEQSGLSQVHSLLLYAGPLYSRLDGDFTVAGVRTDFDEEQDFGVLAGADVFLAHNLAIGGQIQYFDEYAFNLTARYHF